MKQQAAWAEADRQEKETEKQEALRRAESEPKKFKTSAVNGYFVWQRNEHLTIKVGALEKPWKKRVDEVTGRHFFKNTLTKTTTWVDPRSFQGRKHDALTTVGDELPYGWDEAETADGIVFYIDHTTNTHHKEHPRIELQKKQAQYAKKEQENAEAKNKHLETLKELRSKRTRVAAMLTAASDDQERATLVARLEAMDRAIDAEQNKLSSVKNANAAMLKTIELLRKKKDKIMSSAVDSEAATRSAASIWMKKALKGRK